MDNKKKTFIAVVMLGVLGVAVGAGALLLGRSKQVIDMPNGATDLDIKNMEETKAQAEKVFQNDYLGISFKLNENYTVEGIGSEDSEFAGGVIVKDTTGAEIMTIEGVNPYLAGKTFNSRDELVDWGLYVYSKGSTAVFIEPEKVIGRLVSSSQEAVEYEINDGEQKYTWIYRPLVDISYPFGETEFEKLAETRPLFLWIWIYPGRENEAREIVESLEIL